MPQNALGASKPPDIFLASRPSLETRYVPKTWFLYEGCISYLRCHPNRVRAQIWDAPTQQGLRQLGFVPLPNLRMIIFYYGHLIESLFQLICYYHNTSSCFVNRRLKAIAILWI
ncbi:MAG: hypothetical protein GDA56_32660 [Hormoscilla sp. GM7CHS1pb]|nr:hypothetical protein [Hormoscilla sp. GM7CHS1pb]